MANRVAEIINECGLSKLAKELGHDYASRVQGWRDRATVPPSEIPEFLAAVKKLGVTAEIEDLVGPSPEKAGRAA